MKTEVKTRTPIKRKLTKVIGTETYLNVNTGEYKELVVVEKDVRDFNFHKVWLMDLLAVLDLIGTQKIKILDFLLSEMRTQDNTVSVTYRYIEKKTGISYQTVAFTMKALQEANLIKKIRTGTYQFNPDIIVKGGARKREALLVKYNFIEEPQEEER